MSEVFLCRTGQLSAASRRELKRAGVVVVEVEDPAECQFIRSTAPVSSDDMLWAAMEALTVNYKYAVENDVRRSRFAVKLFELMEAARSAKKGESGKGTTGSE